MDLLPILLFVSLICFVLSLALIDVLTGRNLRKFHVIVFAIIWSLGVLWLPWVVVSARALYIWNVEAATAVYNGYPLKTSEPPHTKDEIENNTKTTE
jgi:predicted membrane protein